MDQHSIIWKYPDCDWPVTRELLGSSMTIVQDGVFFDGHTFAVFTPEAIDTELEQRILTAIEEANPKKIMVWGWRCGKLVELIHGYKLVGLDLGRQHNGLLKIEIERFRKVNHRTGRHWSAPQRLADSVFIEKATRNVRTEELMQLLEFILPQVQDPVDQKYIRLFENWCQDQKSKTFVARSRKTEALLGFLTLRVLDSSYCFIAWTATASETRYISDALYSIAIEWALKNQYSIDLGFGGTAGLFRFKKKWNPTSILIPKKQYILQQA